MTFANPARVSGEEINKELEREVVVQRLVDGKEMTVSVRLSQDLLARKPVEFVLIDKEAPVVEAPSSIPVEPTVVTLVALEVTEEEAPVVEAEVKASKGK